MKNFKNILAGVTLIMAANFVSASRYDNGHTYAPVVDVQPIYENIRVPQNRRVCEDSNRSVRGRQYGERRTSGGGAVLGGIVGGLLGNRFGGGSGRDAATAAGVIAGAVIGSGVERNNRRYNSRYNRNSRRVCYTQRDYYEEQRIVGYDVAYEYIGRTYHTRLQNHPGDRVRIQVNVQVAEH